MFFHLLSPFFRCVLYMVLGFRTQPQSKLLQGKNKQLASQYISYSTQEQQQKTIRVPLFHTIHSKKCYFLANSHHKQQNHIMQQLRQMKVLLEYNLQYSGIVHWSKFCGLGGSGLGVMSHLKEESASVSLFFFKHTYDTTVLTKSVIQVSSSESFQPSTTNGCESNPI